MPDSLAIIHKFSSSQHFRKHIRLTFKQGIIEGFMKNEVFAIISLRNFGSS